MTRAALEIMKYVAEKFVAAGYPNRKDWNLSSKKERDPIYGELVTRGYFERHGAGSRHFILSQEGVDWILEYTDTAGASSGTGASLVPKPELGARLTDEAPLTEAERQTVEEAKRQIERTIRDSHYPIGLDFSDERPIVQDEVAKIAVAAGWRVERRGVWLSISRSMQ